MQVGHRLAVIHDRLSIRRHSIFLQRHRSRVCVNLLQRLSATDRRRLPLLLAFGCCWGRHGEIGGGVRLGDARVSIELVEGVL